HGLRARDLLPGHRRPVGRADRRGGRGHEGRERDPHALPGPGAARRRQDIRPRRRSGRTGDGSIDRVKRHRLIRREEIELTPALPEHSHGLTRAVLIGEATGATHTGLMLVSLVDGHVDTHLHSFESSFYVFSGEPVLYLDGRGVRLRPNACGAIPVGVPHAWRSEGKATWIEMASPRPRGPDQPRDTFFLGGAPSDPPADLDLRDPRNRNLFFLADSDMDVDRLGAGAKLSEPTLSPSIAPPPLLLRAIPLKMPVAK